MKIKLQINNTYADFEIDDELIKLASEHMPPEKIIAQECEAYIAGCLDLIKEYKNG